MADHIPSPVEPSPATPPDETTPVGAQSLSSSSSQTTTNNSASTKPTAKSTHRSRKQQREDDRANWVNGKRPKGYRTPEGREAAEKCKNYKSGVSIPYLTHSCKTYEGVLKHAILGAIRTNLFAYLCARLAVLCKSPFLPLCYLSIVEGGKDRLGP